MSRRAVIAALAAAAALAIASPAFGLSVEYSILGTLGEGGWYVSPVSVKWNVTGESSTTNCDTKTFNQDTVDTATSCTATDGNGGSFTRVAHVHLDLTPPSGVTATPARPPDSGGAWYTSPVDLTWSATDATSGVASCTALTYAGPDAGAAAPAGTCRDRAGNTSAPVPFALAFDATAPLLTATHATVSGTGATVRWSAGADVASTTVVRTPGDGSAPDRAMDLPAGVEETAEHRLVPGRTYTWTVTVRDQAGNASTATTSAAIPRSAFVTGAGVQNGRVIRWRAPRGADYYNIQLIRKGHKVLSAWPKHARYALKHTWIYAGRRHRLMLGVYQYYVWAGYGARSLNHYGGLLAHGRVRVQRS
jgi:hypothetical protein